MKNVTFHHAIYENNKVIEIHTKDSISVQQKEVQIQFVPNLEKNTSIAEGPLIKIVFNMFTERLASCRKNTQAIVKVNYDNIAGM